jgi:hypothetical protein
VLTLSVYLHRNDDGNRYRIQQRTQIYNRMEQSELLLKIRDQLKPGDREQIATKLDRPIRSVRGVLRGEWEDESIVEAALQLIENRKEQAACLASRVERLTSKTS